MVQRVSVAASVTADIVWSRCHRAPGVWPYLMIEEAQAARAPSQAFVDRFARIYTPIVLLLAVLITFLPPLLFGQPFGDWFYRAPGAIGHRLSLRPCDLHPGGHRFRSGPRCPCGRVDQGWGTPGECRASKSACHRQNRHAHGRQAAGTACRSH